MSTQAKKPVQVPFTKYEEFHKVDLELREAGKAMSDRYLTHTKMALTFFHGKGSNNIQIINDILDTASAMRLNRNKIMDWLAPLVGHEVVKVEGADRLFKFGSKKEDTSYDEVAAGAFAHFEKYPSWEEFRKDADPEEFDGKSTYEKTIKLLDRRMKKFAENGMHHVAEQLRVTIDSLKSAEKAETFFVVGVQEPATEAEPSDDAEGQALQVANG